MRKLTRSLLASTAVVGLLVLPVAGAVGADNTVTFTVDAAAGSNLSIANGGGSVGLDDGGANPVFDATNPGSVSGSLPATTVTDQRGELVGAWTVSVASDGDWENQADTGVTVAASNARAYLDAADLPSLVTTLGAGLDGMVLTGAELTAGTNDLGSSYTLIAGTTTLGNGSVVYTPAIDITVPADTPAGTYEAVVSQTVS